MCLCCGRGQREGSIIIGQLQQTGVESLRPLHTHTTESQLFKTKEEEKTRKINKKIF